MISCQWKFVVLYGVVLFCFWGSILAQGSQDSYIGQAFRATDPFRVLPNIRGAQDIWIRPRSGEDITVHVIGERNGMYMMKIYQNGLPRKGQFLIDKDWAEKTFQLRVVDFFRYLEKELDSSTRSPSQTDCPQPIDFVERQSDSTPVAPPFQSGAPIQLVSPSYRYQGPNPRDLKFHPGCEILAQPILEDDFVGLRHCLAKLRRIVVAGGESSDHRDNILCNLYSKLNPVEQKFAAYTFTAALEAGIIASSKRNNSPPVPPPKYQELAYVMKVIQNRTKSIQREFKGSDYNELDIVLATSQFSPYNPRIFARYVEQGFWRAEVPPGFQVGLDHAVKAFIALQNDNNFSPRPQVDMVDHFYSPKSMDPPGRVPDFASAKQNCYLKNFFFQGIAPALPRSEGESGYDYAHQFYYNCNANKKRVSFGGRDLFPNNFRTACGS